MKIHQIFSARLVTKKYIEKNQFFLLRKTNRTTEFHAE